MSMEDDLTEWFATVLAQHEERAAGLDAAFVQLESVPNRLARVTLLQYLCKRGCTIARVIRLGGSTLCRVRDYKYSRGLNESASVPLAREKNTLDGDRHWPGHVFDVEDLSQWGDRAGMSVNCRHYRGMLKASDVLAAVADATPGRPAKPIRLGVS